MRQASNWSPGMPLQPWPERCIACLPKLVPAQAAELETLARLWQRESILLPIALYLDAHEVGRDATEGPAIIAQPLPGRSCVVCCFWTRARCGRVLGRASLVARRRQADPGRAASRRGRLRWVESAADSAGTLGRTVQPESRDHRADRRRQSSPRQPRARRRTLCATPLGGLPRRTRAPGWTRWPSASNPKRPGTTSCCRSRS